MALDVKERARIGLASGELASRPRIALVGAGRTEDPSYFSGIPARLAEGLIDLGVDVVHINGEPPGLTRAAITRPTMILERGRASLARRTVPRGSSTQALGMTRSVIAQARLRWTPRLDGVVQFSSELSLSPRVAVATFDDMTVIQAGRLYPEWLSPRALASRASRQAANYGRATACCATTSWAGRSIVEDYGISTSKVHIVGVGSNRAPSLGARDWSTPRYLFVGVDWERKNGQLVLDAFSQVRLEHPGAELHVVGRHPAISAPGVFTHGLLRRDSPDEQQRLDTLFQSATCFVLPSHCEPGAVAYVEACSVGLPCIATGVGGSADLVGPGGTYVDPASGSELVAAMRRFAQPAEAARVGRAALRHSAAFTWSGVASRVLEALGIKPTARVPAHD